MNYFVQQIIKTITYASTQQVIYGLFNEPFREYRHSRMNNRNKKTNVPDNWKRNDGWESIKSYYIDDTSNRYTSYLGQIKKMNSEE